MAEGKYKYGDKFEVCWPDGFVAYAQVASDNCLRWLKDGKELQSVYISSYNEDDWRLIDRNNR